MEAGRGRGRGGSQMTVSHSGQGGDGSDVGVGVGFGVGVGVGGGGEPTSRSLSSSPGLSTPPRSPEPATTTFSPNSVARSTAAAQNSHPQASTNGFLGGAHSRTGLGTATNDNIADNNNINNDDNALANNNPTTSANSRKNNDSWKNDPSNTNSATTATTTTRRPRKKKDATATADASTDDKPKERKPRKPREPRVKDVATNAAATTAAGANPAVSGPRKRQKTSDPNSSKRDNDGNAPAEALLQPAAALRQQKIKDLVGNNIRATPQASTISAPSMARSHSDSNSDVIHIASPSVPAPGARTSSTTTTTITAARPASSGQHYDPIRSATIEATPSRNPSSSVPISPPSKLVNRASASPSIRSLIDPQPPDPSVAVSNPIFQPEKVRSQAAASKMSASASPAPPQAKQTSSLTANGSTSDGKKSTSLLNAPVVANPSPMEMDIDDEGLLPKQNDVKKAEIASAGPSSSAATPTPKPHRQREAPPPLPSGSGLLGPTSAPNGTYGTNIVLHFDLKGTTNNTINFAQEVEKKYGRDALRPRQAAHRDRMAQMAAAAAFLEKDSGSNGSADDMSDASDQESNVEMGGMDAGDAAGSGTGAANGKKPVRRRKPNKNEYNLDDDFIDDTELAWEEQAAVAKDGFFVYSGPLVPEGEKPAVERPDGTVKRGRGRGRGGSTRGDASTRGGRGGGTAASSAAASGGGRGSRGGTTVRKPRVTKAERAQREQEKLDREKLAANLPHLPPKTVVSSGAA